MVGGSSFLCPVEDMRVVDHEQEGRVAFREGDGACNVVCCSQAASSRGRFDACGRHQFCFGHGRDRKADGTLGDLAFRDIDALVNLDMRADVDSGGLRVVGQGRDVLLEQVQVDQQGRGGQDVFGDAAEIAASDPSVQLGIRIAARRGSNTSAGRGCQKARSARCQKLTARTHRTPPLEPLPSMARFDVPRMPVFDAAV